MEIFEVFCERIDKQPVIILFNKRRERVFSSLSSSTFIIYLDFDLAAN